MLLPIVLLLLLRLYFILPNPRRIRKVKHELARYNLSVFLGSGGHTTEMLTLVSSLDPERYIPRKYYISEGDTLSAEKVAAMEHKLAPVDYEDPEHIIPYTITNIPRARRVHQPLYTTPFSAFISFIHCLWHTSRVGNQPTLVLMNGPGTCVVLCMAVYVHKMFWQWYLPELVYVESFARVKSLSLSGKLLRPFVDTFIVQWPELAEQLRKKIWGGEVVYRGCLV